MWFTLDSQFILGRELKGGVALWNAFTLKETRRLWGDSTNQTAVALSPDADRVVVGDAAGRLHVWDVRSGLESTNFIVASGPFSVRFTGNGKSLLTSSFQSAGTNLVFETWDAASWQRKGSLAVESKELWDVMTTSLPDSIVLMTDRAFRFLDVTKPDGAPKQIERHKDNTHVAVSPDGRTAAASSHEGFVELWDMTTLQPVDSFKGFMLGSHSVAFSPDGRRLGVGGDGPEAVKLWDAETRQEVLTLSGEGSLFYTLRFSPDGRFLLAINQVGLAHLWQAPSWEEIAAVEAKEKAESKQP